MNNPLQTTGKINLQELAEGRLQLHYAIQFIAAPGLALVKPQPDYSQMSLDWHPELTAFVGQVIQAEKPFRVALDPVSLTVILVDTKDSQIAAFPLHGKTMTEGLDWLKGEISKLGADANKVVWLDYPPDDFPDHGLAHGTPFDASRQEAARKELMNYYANTNLLLQEIVAVTEGASPIHTWPHHFDMATLISLNGKENGESMTIGIGLSPGDKSYDEPYWYVTPWPYPATDNLPQLDGGGLWHTQHWVGAVLIASQLGENNTGEARQTQIRSFLYSALKAAKTLLEGSSIKGGA